MIALPLIVVLFTGCAGNRDTAVAQRARPYLIDTPELQVAVAKSAWFEPAEFRRWIADRKQDLRDMGAPSPVVSQFDDVLPATRGMELHMVKEIESGSAIFCRLGYFCGKDATVRIIRRSAIVLHLRNPETGEIVEASDKGQLIYESRGMEKVFHDTSRRAVDLDRDLQDIDEEEKPSVVFARMDPAFRGWTVIGAHLDDQNVQVMSLKKEASDDH